MKHPSKNWFKYGNKGLPNVLKKRRRERGGKIIKIHVSLCFSIFLIKIDNGRRDIYIFLKKVIPLFFLLIYLLNHTRIIKKRERKR